MLRLARILGAMLELSSSDFKVTMTKTRGLAIVGAQFLERAEKVEPVQRALHHIGRQ